MTRSVVIIEIIKMRIDINIVIISCEINTVTVTSNWN